MAKRPDLKLAALSAHPLLAGCGRRELERLGRLTELVEPSAGARLVEAGDEVRWVYLILDGQVEVRRGGRAVDRLGGGDLVGMATALLGRPSPTTALAATDLRAFALTGSALRAVVSTMPSVATAAAACLASEVVRLERGASRAGGRRGTRLSSALSPA